ncbi:MAG: sulfur carrier protein ThiS [Prevotella sp.]|nr:sulfur carrier protein ThiS [Prevotella sp.]
MAKILVNGESQEVVTPISVTGLIKQNNVENPELVSVQLNEEFIDHADFDTTLVNDGDEIDFLYFMGGGQAYV